jgi:hypothetical protein
LGEIWLTGTMAGAFMWIPVTPIEGIKARLQVQYALKEGESPVYRGTVHAYKKVYQEVGLRGCTSDHLALASPECKGF